MSFSSSLAVSSGGRFFSVLTISMAAPLFHLSACSFSQNVILTWSWLYWLTPATQYAMLPCSNSVRISITLILPGLFSRASMSGVNAPTFTIGGATSLWNQILWLWRPSTLEAPVALLSARIAP
jgi:hypothetical protein